MKIPEHQPIPILATIALIAMTLGADHAFGQSTISGVVNQYASAQAIVGNSKVLVNDPSVFGTNDRILLIQMQGATIDSSNTATFGIITDTGSAGRYEYNSICGIAGDTLELANEFANTYAVPGKTQVVRVPLYTDAIVNGPLTASPWDGSTGGVIAIEVTGTLILFSDIDASGMGFKGGEYTPSSASCAWYNNYSDFYYPSGNGNGLEKGQGIADYITNKEDGKGPQGNGGGGGNNHNSGGGGGANAGAGGQGGDNQDPGDFTCHGFNPGLGGKALVATSSRWYLGGGGGCGHGNNMDPGTISSGGAGGGIIFIRADSIIANGYQISAAGAAGGYALNDGAGGGGAGGTVILDVNKYHVSGLNIDVSGGDGGDADNDGQERCFGPGGGGGGGAVFSTASLPVQVTAYTTGGTAGETINSISCNGSLNAANGGPGNTSSNATITESNVPGSGCVNLLPIEGLQLWLEEKGNDHFLKWKMSNAYAIKRFEVELLDELGKDNGLGNVPAKSASEAEYSFPLPRLSGGRYYLRLGAVKEDLPIEYSSWIPWLIPGETGYCQVRPNPVTTDQSAIIHFEELEPAEIDIEAFDATGRRVHWSHSQAQGRKMLQFARPGIYYISISNGIRRCQEKIIVRP